MCLKLVCQHLSSSRREGNFDGFFPMATATAISSTGCTAYTELVNTRPRSGTLGLVGVYGGKYVVQESQLDCGQPPSHSPPSL